MLNDIYETCEKHRRKYGLIQYIERVQCKKECDGNDTCPLNPKNRSGIFV